jgi:hypothetical protein
LTTLDVAVRIVAFAAGRAIVIGDFFVPRYNSHSATVMLIA